MTNHRSHYFASTHRFTNYQGRTSSSWGVVNNEMSRRRNGNRAKTLVDAMRSNALDLAISEVVRSSKSNGGRALNGLYHTTVLGDKLIFHQMRNGGIETHQKILEEGIDIAKN